jgi:hypothetical protein
LHLGHTSIVAKPLSALIPAFGSAIIAFVFVSASGFLTRLVQIVPLTGILRLANSGNVHLKHE